MNISDIRSDARDGIVTVTLRGDIDLADTSDLRDRLAGTITNEAFGLVLDLTQVDYIDSAGIHLIHHLRTNLVTRGQRLAVVVTPESPVSHALRLSGVPWLPEVSDSLEAAQARAAQRESCEH